MLACLDAALPRVDESEGGDVGAAVLEVLQLDEVQVQRRHEERVVRRHYAHLQRQDRVSSVVSVSSTN